MMKIHMVDTIGQYQQIQSEIDAAVLDVVRSGAYINGPAVKRFQAHLATFMDVPHVIPCANGTDALQVAFMALGLEPGDEVITPSFTYIATVEVLALLRLKPVFVEVDPETFNMDPASIEAKITDRTRAILPVHLYGQAADMPAIMSIAETYGLYVVEDTAQAIGAMSSLADGTPARAGTVGHIGTTSFYPSKNLGAFGDGGAIFTRDADLAERLWSICNHGSHTRYYHDRVGVNSRLDAVQAAILDVKLQRLDAYNEARREAARTYDRLFAGVEGVRTPAWKDDGSHVFHQYTLRLAAGRETRDHLQAQLGAEGIPSMIYYPVPIHLQQGYTDYGYQSGDLPLTENLTAEVISLPMHTELDETQQVYIVDHVKRILRTFSTITP
ncbi:MAG: DegT/DnrJ/EryC1/StrS family aminotransferase [Bacteroidetes bacterium]|nr:MAG: DegT/DnrJ/EryC1/StrS family aminotransferase [Bacteroidota bacterium]